MSVIYILTTGGTIEKSYSETDGSVLNAKNKLERYLARLRRPGVETYVVPVMNKDSLEMNDQDRALLFGIVKGLLAESAPLVITHGTDTMVETGLYLKHALPEVHVPIVLTGAMTPLGFEDSDGLQNLTESLFAVRLIPAGFYIVMHGRVFPVDRVRKDRERAQFVWADPPLSPRVQ
jgi:L-asparaginase